MSDLLTIADLVDKMRRLNPRRENPTYNAVHLRLRVDRGPARAHRCHDCGKSANEWSLDRTLVAQLHIELSRGPDRRGRELDYAVDLRAYLPRCHSCHKQHDGHRRGVCRTGHDLSGPGSIYVSRTGGEQCRECRNAAKRAHYARTMEGRHG